MNPSSFFSRWYSLNPMNACFIFENFKSIIIRYFNYILFYLFNIKSFFLRELKVHLQKLFFPKLCFFASRSAFYLQYYIAIIKGFFGSFLCRFYTFLQSFFLYFQLIYLFLSQFPQRRIREQRSGPCNFFVNLLNLNFSVIVHMSGR